MQGFRKKHPRHVALYPCIRIARWQVGVLSMCSPMPVPRQCLRSLRLSDLDRALGSSVLRRLWHACVGFCRAQRLRCTEATAVPNRGERTQFKSRGGCEKSAGKESYGGEGGIRTPDTLTGMSDFESGAFNRALPPLRLWIEPLEVYLDHIIVFLCQSPCLLLDEEKSRKISFCCGLFASCCALKD